MATRFYFPATGTAPCSPTFGLGATTAWSDTTQATRFPMTNRKGTTAITIGTRCDLDIGGGFNALDRQYISDPLEAQTISGTWSMQLMVREYQTGDDANSVPINIQIISNDGSSANANDILAAGVAAPGTGTTAEFINNVSHRNCIVANAQAFDSSVTCNWGDRIMIEIGYRYNTLTGATPEASGKWGENATDLPVNDTQTTNGAPWLEFSQDLIFISTPQLDMMGVGV